MKEIRMRDIKTMNISENCTPVVYSRGSRYFNSGRVIGIEPNITHNINTVSAKVRGSKIYTVNILFTREKGYVNSHCDCPAFYSYSGYCKHIVATFLYLKSIDFEPFGEEKRERRRPEEYGDIIISYFENRSVPPSRRPIDIEVTLEMVREHYYSRKLQPILSMRMGTDRLYVVRNMKEVIEVLLKGKTLKFGQQFTYDHRENYFKTEDKPFIDFLLQMYDIDYESSSTGLFTGKYLYLPDSLVRLILDMRKPFGIGLNIEERKYGQLDILEKNLPADFNLNMDEKGLLLDIDVPLDIVTLTTDGSYIFYDNAIYNISNEQKKNLMPLYKIISDSRSKTVRFSKSESDRFASFVIPNLKSIGNVNIEKSVQKLFYEAELKAELYLDKKRKSIIADLKFVYGEYEIYPFSKSKPKHDKIIIRDSNSEQKVLDMLERSEFRVKGKVVYLQDDDKIYEFITEIIPDMQEVCHIYYSEDFKNMKIYNSSYYGTSVSLNEDQDMLEFSFDIDGIDKRELQNIFASLREKKKYYRLKDGSFIPLDERLEDVSSVIDYLDIDEKELIDGAVMVSKHRAMYLDDRLEELKGIQFERDIAFKRLVENIKRPKDIDYKLPDGLSGTLRNYQITGFKWLKTLSSYGLGGILADDMGLGKTFQTIAFLLSEKKDISLPSIVICPTSIMYNWESEVEKFAPGLKALVVSGPKDYRGELIKKAKNADIIITSYPLIRRDIISYKDMEFAYCILDEAQHIKNPSSVNARSVKDIRARGYFALTGTPIENNLTELWSIFDFLMPGYLLSHKKFSERFERPIALGQDKEAIKELRRHIKPFILRRLKGDVL
ncbi:MAG: helicase, partial [Clostridiales bacterium]|nr:helicase [Clostridiales bacterium]